MKSLFKAKKQPKPGQNQVSKISYSLPLVSLLSRHPFLATIGLISLLLATGVVGYMIIERWSFTEALFMTIITITTIGYGETRPLSSEGRIFTIVLIVVGVIAASYALTTTIELFTSQEFLERMRSRRRRKTLEQIRDHTIIGGFGRLGRNLAKELKMLKTPLIIVDSDPTVVEECHQLGLPAVLGNAANEQVLSEAGIERAKSLVAAANSDAENVFIVLTAKSIKPDLRVISRCNLESSIPKIEKAGADAVLSPYAITGRRIAQMLTRPNVVSFLDGILEFGDHKMRIEEFIINQESPLAGLTLKEAKLKVAILAVDHPNKMVFTHPNADTKLLPGTAIIAMGVEDELSKVAQLVGG